MNTLYLHDLLMREVKQLQVCQAGKTLKFVCCVRYSSLCIEETKGTQISFYGRSFIKYFY